MIFKKVILVFCLMVLVGCIFAQENKSEKSTTKSKAYDYNIGPQDLLTISVFEVPELNITVRVAEDGTIALPLLGVVKVEGLNQLQLENTLATLLEKSYLKNAQVTVFIKEYQSKKVSIIGAVQKTGDYELIGKQTLLQMLSRAGGILEKAGDKIIVIRQYKNGKSASLSIDIEELMLKGNPRLNIPLQPNDIINVPMERYGDVYIFGQVNEPGQIQMKKSRPLTLLRAIAQAGGFTERARKSAVLITRRQNGKEIKIKVNVRKILSGKRPDFILKPNDVIYVKASVL
jgi:polysaccharide export outer membrane protein